MLQPQVVADLRKAIKEGRAKSVYGARVDADTVFSTSAELEEVAAGMAQGAATSQGGQEQTWSIVEPTEPLPLRVTDVAHYHFDETSGTTAADQSRNDNNLTVSGGTWGTGKFGNCLVLDGTDDLASGDMASAEPIRNYLYLSAWVKPTSLTGTRPVVLLNGYVLVYLDAGVLKAQFTFSGVTTTVSSDLTAVTGTWQFVTLQFQDGNVLLALGDLVHRETIANTTW